MAYTLTDRWKYYYDVGFDGRQTNLSINGAGTNYRDSTSFTFFPATPVANSYVQFCFVKRWWGLKLDIGTAFSATSVEFIWEYSKTNTTTWATLRVDNPNVFLSTGVQYVNFTPPADWYVHRENGYKIRCRIVSISGFSTNATQQNDRVRYNLKAIVVTGTETNTLGTTLLTANNAGTYTTLPATTCATGLIPIQASVYAIRDIAKIDCVLSGTSAGAGDTITITGNDFDGNALTETIDVSGGNGTYTSTLAYADVTQIDCNGWSDGTITVTQKKWGMIEETAPNTYVLNCHFQVGDGTTTTTVQWNDYFVTFMRGAFWYVLPKGTFNTGTVAGSGTSAEDYLRGVAIQEGTYLDGDFGIGSDFRGEAMGTGVANIGGSFWALRKGAYSEPLIRTTTGTFNFYNSIISAYHSGSRSIYSNSTRNFKNTNVHLNIQHNAGTITSTSGSILHNLSAEINAASTTISNTPIRSTSSIWFYTGVGVQTYENCDGVTTSSFGIGWNGVGNGNEKIRIAYSLDLFVMDEAGDPISGATITITNGVGAVTSTTTDANGVITQQSLVAYSGSYIAFAPAITWVDKSAYTIEIAKDGYSTKTMIFTLSEKVDDIVVLQPACVPAETIMLESGELAKRIADTPMDGFYIKT